jgi:hypothetical protein
MGWVRASCLVWLGLATGAGCSGKYTDDRDGSSAGMSNASCGGAELCDVPSAGKPSGAGVGGTGSTNAPSVGGTTNTPSFGGTLTAGGTPATDPNGGLYNVSEYTLNCGTWVRCDDSSRCAAGEDCVALSGCDQGVCATTEIMCRLYCGDAASCHSAPSGLTRVRLVCPSTIINGFESSAGSGGYPPGYPG